MKSHISARTSARPVKNRLPFPRRMLALAGTAVLGAHLALPGVLNPVPAEATTVTTPNLLMYACEKVGFDTNNENWRVASVATYSNSGAGVQAGITLANSPRASGWTNADGLPPGSLRNPDLSGSSFTEIWTPLLPENGYSTDYSSIIGRTISYDYRQGHAVSPSTETKRYAGIVGKNGFRMWYPLINGKLKEGSLQWQRVKLELDPSQWTRQAPQDVRSNWAGGGSVAESSRPTPEQFAAALADVDRFIFAIEYDRGSRTEVAYFDNFGLDCELSVDKTSSAGASSNPGDLVSYTVTVENTGEGEFTAASPARVEDDLADVLDDGDIEGPITATYLSNGAPSGEPFELPAGAIQDGKLTWEGPLDIGEGLALNYAVRLHGGGDLSVANTACVPAEFAPIGEDCASTTTAMPRLEITKAASQTELPENGGSVDYEITVTNTGPGRTTTDQPATFTDDLSNVLDDATIDESTLNASSGVASISGNTLRWEGELDAGETATVTYTAVYDASRGGDRVLLNTACLDDSFILGGASCAENQIPAAALTSWKTSDPSSGPVGAGDEITYTLHFKNEGKGPAKIVNADDLTAVLDDADLISEPAALTDSVTANLNDGVITLGGTVAPESETTVSYTVRVKPLSERGDSIMTNALMNCNASDETLCEPTVHTVPHLGITKSASVDSATTGDEVTYTVTVTNDGTGPYTAQYPATFTDDLTDVLKDASWTDDVTATSGAATYAEPLLNWTGPLEPGKTATVTYTVVVNNNGDHELVNIATAPNKGEDDVRADTIVPLGAIIASKQSDPESGSAVEAGDTITYTLEFTNVGKASAEVTYTDVLTDVLDDATLTENPTTSTASISVGVTPENDFAVAGILEPAETATVSYSVQVKEQAKQGNKVLANYLLPTGSDKPETCVVESESTRLCTTHPITQADPVVTVPSDQEEDQPGLAETGDDFGYLITSVALAAAFTLAGLAMVTRRRQSS